MGEKDITTIQKRIKKQDYITAVYEIIANFIPNPPRKEEVNTNQKLQKLLLDTYSSSSKLLLTEPIKKAMNFALIANCLNSYVSSLFTPEYLKNVKLCINYQTIAVAYIKKSFKILQKNGCMIPFEDVNDLNFLLNIVELNLYVIMISDKGKIYGDKDIYLSFRTISQRLEALIKKEPNPEYYKTQSLVYNYMHNLAEAKKAAFACLQAGSLKTNLQNINSLGYKILYQGKLHPVMIYQ